MSAPLNGFFINLDRSTPRREHMESELRRVGIDWVERFAAIDGRTLVPLPECKLSAGELACFHSHLQIIETTPADSFTMILEDDVQLSEDLPLVLRAEQLDGLTPYDVIFLDCQPFWATHTLLTMWASLKRQLIDAAHSA